MHKAQRLINHVALVLDGSASMSGHSRNLVKVADEQIKHLALRSEEMSQETRVSVYLFNHTVQCLIFDMDVMRLPSIADLYRASGMTALIDATVQSQEDLATTSQIYGDHAFLTFVLTDGHENRSKRSWASLSQVLSLQPENWTTGFLVPDSTSEAALNRVGALEGSVAIWDVNSASGINDAVSTIRTATDNFMVARSAGVRGTKTVFSTGLDAVNKQTVSANLKPLKDTEYTIFKVGNTIQISDGVREAVGYYTAGMGYYQLTKAETIQPNKQIVVVDKSTLKAYSGSHARDLIGLPHGVARVRPNHNPEYEVYVQSTSHNRKLLANTRVLVMR